MTLHFTPYSTALIVSTLIDLGLGIVVWRRRSERGVGYIALALFAISEWTFFVGLEASVVGDLATRILISKLSYLGIYSCIPLFLHFILMFTWNERWLTRRNIFLIWVVPVIMIVMVMTNDYHGLIWSGFHYREDLEMNILIYERGPFYWLGVVNNYVALVIMSVVMVSAIFRFKNIYRIQAIIMLLGIQFPWLGNITYLISSGPLAGIDLTPVGFSISGILLSWGVLRLRLLDLYPVAREALFEKIGDGIIVLDDRKRIVDVNQAGAKLLGKIENTLVGLPAEVILARFPLLLEHLNDEDTRQLEVCPQEELNYNLEADITPLRNPAGRADGWLIGLRDVSGRKHAEQQIMRLYQEAQLRLKEQSILNRVNQIVSSTLNMEEMVSLIYQQVKSFVDSPCFVVASYDAARDLFSGTVIREQQAAALLTFRGTQSLFGHHVGNERPLFLRNLSQIEFFMRESGRHPIFPNVKCIMTVPLIAKGTLVGVMSIEHDQLENAFSDEDYALFFSISSQIAIAFENARLFKMSERLATTDSLTEIANRRFFFIAGANEIERAIRYQRPLSAIMMDLDYFKNVNDRFGHAVGDRVLQMIAHLCNQALRGNDIFGRYGGEEFAILLPETDLKSAYAVAERIRQLVTNASFHGIVDEDISMTVSLGVTALNGRHLSLDALLEAADSALYRAKREGRNRVQMG